MAAARGRFSPLACAPGQRHGLTSKMGTRANGYSVLLCRLLVLDGPRQAWIEVGRVFPSGKLRLMTYTGAGAQDLALRGPKNI